MSDEQIPVEDGVAASQWRRSAGRVAARVNRALGWEVWVRWWVLGGVAGAVATLWVRSAGGVWWLGLPLFAGLLILGGWLAWKRVREDGWRVEDGLVRMEYARLLHGRLSAASDGMVRWPEAVSGAEEGVGFRWRGGRETGLAAAAVALLVVTCWLPLSERGVEAVPVVPPFAWTQTEALLEHLEEVEGLEEESLEKFREALEQLKGRPTEEWYAHGSLEAGESLLAHLEANARQLAQGLAGSDAVLGNALAADGIGRMEEGMAAELREALSGLDASELKVSEGLRQALANIGTPEGLRQLSLQELQSIRITMQRIGEGIGEGLGEAFGEGLAIGEGTAGGQEGGDGMLAGGGVDGGGTAPLLLGDWERVAGAGESAGLGSVLGGEVGLGDVVGERFTAPEVTGSVERGEAGGRAVIRAAGAAVLRQAVTPSERRLLERYFGEPAP